MSNLTNWLEIPVKDIRRASKFYGTVLGVTFHEMEMMGMKMAIFPHTSGDVSGALVQGDGYTPGDSGPLVYLNGGKDLNEAFVRIEKAGGKTILPKTQISPEHGYFALFIDSEGNKMALHSQN